MKIKKNNQRIILGSHRHTVSKSTEDRILSRQLRAVRQDERRAREEPAARMGSPAGQTSSRPGVHRPVSLQRQSSLKCSE